METDLGDLPFTVELKLILSALSFGQSEGIDIIDPPREFSELEVLGKPVFYRKVFLWKEQFGRISGRKFWHKLSMS